MAKGSAQPRESNQRRNFCILTKQKSVQSRALEIVEHYIVSSSVALRFLCRAELLNKNYDFAKVVEFLKMSLRDQDKAERQAKLLLKQKEDI